MEIIVPATTTNFGAGFDSLGLALSAEMTLTVGPEQENWTLQHQLGALVPSDATNPLIEIVTTLCPNVTPHQLTLTSNIPVQMGLGGSSAMLVAGIELANQLGQLGLDNEAKLQLAVQLEGHPDNVAPAIFGGFVVGDYQNQWSDAVKLSFPDVRLLAYLPPRTLATKTSRSVLPAEVPFATAVTKSSAANVLIAALLEHDFDAVKRVINQGSLHETARAQFVPELAQIRSAAAALETMGTYLSGGGPTVMTLAFPEKVVTVRQQLDQQLNLPGEWCIYTPNLFGVRVHF
ncbi:homoserine kinase [Lactobacillus selangorensis]|uniref:Homoserine kinase n=1 Tax=Lactobacillus selangorensis TaxID=81857 RepID=A0A0R2FNY9_9LACO|nr:homoserine kinase [Lactobacillus selangorensis]KRN27208.1 homoserine kinase [Lactobacillus selangorensis]KRN29870.1 homoserine kinase [Lactobacillus selangorensis]